MRVPQVAPRPALALMAFCLAASAGACHGPDPYYRLSATAGTGGHAGTGAAGHAGNTGAGAAGTSGAAGFAGVAGAAGAGTAGSGTAGTSGAAGSGAAGTGLAAMPCTKCKVSVEYTCRADEKDTGQASFIVDVTNQASESITLSDLTLRYWYTMEAGKDQQLDCDFAKLGCTNLVTSADTPPPLFQAVMPPRPKANTYVELAFKASALTLDPFLDTGEIQLRLHNKDYSTIDQTDDYSFDCAMKGNPVPSNAITAYVKGVLVWGTEPQ
jgi:hypothetical protein